ncbi:MAG: phosphohistidine phosphatase SixA [Chthoniobacterales bacterium]
MRLYFLRHGEADWPEWEGDDDDRPLTKSGRKEMRQVGELLARLKTKIDVVLTSPLPRACQTADIAAEHLKVRVHEESLLAPGFSFANLATIRRKYPQQVLMLVGHEPDFSAVAAALTGGELKFAKAGVALFELAGRKGKLLWLFPPKIVKN